jgi:tetratricopeptide (TPR) repeat protein
MEVTRGREELADLLERAASSAEATGHLQRALELLSRATEIHRELADRRGTTRTIAGQGHLLLVTSHVPAALELLEEAAAERAELDEVSAAVLDAELARAYMFSDRVTDAIAAIDRGLAVSEARGVTDLTINLLITKSWAMAIRGRQRESFSLAIGAIRFADEFGVLRQQLRGRYNMLEGLRVDTPRAGMQMAHEGIALAERFGQRDWLVSLVANVAPLAVYIGEWDWYLAAFREFGASERGASQEISFMGAAAVITALRGDPDGARRMFEPVRDVSALHDSPQDLMNAHAARALLELACGSPDAVWAEVDSANAAFASHLTTIDAKVLGARAAVWVRDVPRLDHYLSEVRRVTSDLRWANASLDTLEAARAALSGDAMDARERYARAIARWRPLDSQLDLGLALLEYAELGRPDDAAARAAEVEARQVFESLGAQALIARLDRIGAGRGAPTGDSRPGDTQPAAPEGTEASVRS